MKPVRLLRRAGRWCQDRLLRMRMALSVQRARWQEPRLFNAALRQPATQSSTSGSKDKPCGRTARTAGLERAPASAPGGTIGTLGGWWTCRPIGPSTLFASIHAACRGQSSRRGCRSRSPPTASNGTSSTPAAICSATRRRSGPLTIRLLDTKGGRFVKLELPEGGRLSFNQVEVMVERRHRAMLRVAKRYKFNFARMTSLRMTPNAKPYSLRNVPSHFKGEIQALYVDNRQGRFGNNLRQIGTAVCVARQLGVRRVYLSKLPLLEIDRPITFGDVTVMPDSELQHDNPRGVLCGTFYYKSVFGARLQGLGLPAASPRPRALSGSPYFTAWPPSPNSFPRRPTSQFIYAPAISSRGRIRIPSTFSPPRLLSDVHRVRAGGDWGEARHPGLPGRGQSLHSGVEELVGGDRPALCRAVEHAGARSCRPHGRPALRIRPRQLR